jgi:hypothetical protein
MLGDAGSKRCSQRMLICCARVSTSGQDLAAQRDGLAPLGVDEQRVHVDHGLSGTTRPRPGLPEALAASRAGDELVVTKFDRLARSLRDATDIANELAKKGVALNLGGASTTPPAPSAGSCSTSSVLLPGSKPTLSEPPTARAWQSQRPPASSAAEA